MNDQELDQLVAATAPMDDTDVAALDLSGTDHELCEAIMSTPPIETIGGPASSDPDPAGDPSPISLDRGWRRRRPLRVGIATAAAAAAVTALVVMQPFGSDAPEPLGGDDGTAWAAELVEVAEAVPRLLVTAEGWEVDSANDFGADAGGLTYDGPDDAGLALTWNNQTTAGLDTYDDLVAAYDSGNVRLDAITVAGHQAAVFLLGVPDGSRTQPVPSPRPGTHYAVLWQQGDYVVTLIAGPIDEPSLRELASSVQQVDVDTWLSAMPESVIAAASRAAVVQEMLTDIPLPEGFDAVALEDADGAVGQEYTSIGADVTSAVVCAWVDVWAQARDAGDPARMQEAVDAVGSSRDWDVIHEMDRRNSGDWHEILWEIADAMAAGETMRYGDHDVPIDQAVSSMLLCDHDVSSQPAG